MRIGLHLAAIIALTALTQVGGVAWAVSLLARRWWLAFPLIYGLMWGAAMLLAPMTGRVPLPCFGAPLRMQSPVYCLMLRQFVTPELAQIATDAARRVEGAYPGTVTLALDAGFPFVTGMPLLPHLSHDDGRKLDFAFYYTAQGTYVAGLTRSPIGYGAFETLDISNCPPARITLRWDLRALQNLWPDRPLDLARTADLGRILLQDPRVGRLFVEPPLATRLGLSGPRLGFQGCRAARHDDHFHIQL